MHYLKVLFNLAPDNQNFRDILMAMLGNVGFESFVENEKNIEGYIPKKLFDNKSIGDLNFEHLFSFEYVTELVPDQNWNELWEKNYFKPILVSNKCLIRAPFHKEYPKAKYEIVIEPKMAFGTGNHETTALMIEFILGLDLQERNILDMGCGTGILAMLASLKNAGAITAIDIDTWSVDSSIENATNNNCKNIKVLHGNANLLTDQKFDFIFANIHKNILIDDLPKYKQVLNEGGTILLSGFYENDLADIKLCAEKLNLKFIEYRRRNKWVAAKFQKVHKQITSK